MADTKHDSGGQAYPRHFQDQTDRGLADFYIAGMTLPDDFAGRVLQGMFASESNDSGGMMPQWPRGTTPEQRAVPGAYKKIVVEEAYDWAAAMIAEKRRREAPGA